MLEYSTNTPQLIPCINGGAPKVGRMLVLGIGAVVEVEGLSVVKESAVQWSKCAQGLVITSLITCMYIAWICSRSP